MKTSEFIITQVELADLLEYKFLLDPSTTYYLALGCCMSAEMYELVFIVAVGHS